MTALSEQLSFITKYSMTALVALATVGFDLIQIR